MPVLTRVRVLQPALEPVPEDDLGRREVWSLGAVLPCGSAPIAGVVAASDMWQGKILKDNEQVRDDT